MERVPPRYSSVVWRHRAMAALMVAFMLGAMASGLWFNFHGFIWMMAGAAAAGFGRGIWIRFDSARFRRYLRHHKHAVCTACNYVLTAHASPGTCPECGRSFLADKGRDEWRERLEKMETMDDGD